MKSTKEDAEPEGRCEGRSSDSFSADLRESPKEEGTTVDAKGEAEPERRCTAVNLCEGATKGAKPSFVEMEEPVSVEFELAPLLGCAETFRSVLFITSDGTIPLSVSGRSTESFALFAIEETSRIANIAEEIGRSPMITILEGAWTAVEEKEASDVK